MSTYYIKVKVKYINCFNKKEVDFKILKPHDYNLKKNGEKFSETLELLESELIECYPNHPKGIFDLKIYYYYKNNGITESGADSYYVDLRIIKSKKSKKQIIIHYALKNKAHNVMVYSCNQAVGTTKNKLSIDWNKVTCKNCLRQKKRIEANNLPFKILDLCKVIKK